MLKDKIQHIESDKVEVFNSSNKRYGDRLQKCVHKLVEHNVSASQMSAVVVICFVLSGKRVNYELLSEPIIRKMNLQRGILISLQIREELSTKEELTLAIDGACHYGRRYARCNVTDSD